MLSAADRAISRTHCKIVYKNGFHTRPRVPEEWVAFFMLFHPRVGHKANLPWLPIPLRMMILRYLVETAFYLIDMGSTYGTYVRLKAPHPPCQQPLFKGLTVLFGNDVYLNVVEVWNESGNELDFGSFLQQEIAICQIHCQEEGLSAIIKEQLQSPKLSAGGNESDASEGDGTVIQATHKPGR